MVDYLGRTCNSSLLVYVKRSKMKLYLSIVLMIILAIGIFGFILPFLFSATSTIAVILGVLGIVILFPLFYILGKSISTQTIKKIKDFEKGEKK